MAQNKLALLTGFPGYIGSELAITLLQNDPELEILAVVREPSFNFAKRELDSIEARMPAVTGRIRLAIGDITSPDLGLWRYTEDVLPRIREIYHLATTYKLKAEPGFTQRINVVATRNVLDLARQCPELQRIHYLSTVHVSGLLKGTFSEDELLHECGFKNFYERTEYDAELEVRNAGLPVTIYRAGILAGDSRTGHIPKFDGPMGTLQHMLRAPFILSRVGTGKAEVNMVPTDYVAHAIAYLAKLPETVGGTYHLVDPKPMTAHELSEWMSHTLNLRSIQFPLPPRLVTGLLEFKPLSEWLGVPAQTIDYLTHEVSYSCEKTRALLEKAGITCPSPTEYLEKVMDFARNQGLGAIA